ncbi:glycoside hydrolase family 36 protein [Glycomyces paridis]|uniref:Alpha-galactosidase n=1 Tax=Glycomyces paridis TaxID=2126555 RepID=A0A4S8PLY9_9ACTN|nr:glycoside hydrolase family 36 protein [Glycomyces paridis]THV29559.1 alpha-galactosidase [Glycomyces paridis]
MTKTDDEFEWTRPGLHLRFAHGDGPVRLVRLATGPDARSAAAPCPIVELHAGGRNRENNTQIYVRSAVGVRLRYAGHESVGDDLRIRQVEEATGIEVVSVFRAAGPGLQITQTVRNGGTRDLVLTMVASAVFSVAGTGYDVLWGRAEWLGEGRWEQRPLAEVLPDLSFGRYGFVGRGHFPVTSHGSWSSGEVLPTGVLASEAGPSVAWQIETSAGWHWELSRDAGTVTVGVLGPTDLEHQFAERLAPGREFTSVPAGVVVADGGRDAAFAALTEYRRAIRVPRAAHERHPVVYNDYMNTLMGDPSTEKLLPLVAAAAAAGAEYLCIDAGWFADPKGWWFNAGEWREDPDRFTGGLRSVTEAIREAGMVPGLWLEPEGVGVESPVAAKLPDEAFFCRFGERVVEGNHFQLDLRHPAARAHLDETVDRLVGEFGVGFFKLDYNVNIGAGTDVDAEAPGAGLLGHTRALRNWLLAVQERHPDLLLESCSSGGMRMDYHLLSAVHLQSTSDQQDYRRYPVVAAAAPASVLPEQAGNWAYPDASMTLEETAFAMASGVMGRMYLSGFLHDLGEEQSALVREAVVLHRERRGDIASSVPVWPLGLPGWDDDVVALLLDAGPGGLLAVWSRGDAAELALPGLAGREVRQVYPAGLPTWTVRDRDGVPVIDVPPGLRARIFQIGRD